MVRTTVVKKKGEAGQAVVLVVVAMSIFLLGAVGLAIDGSQLYAQRQMAQSAADAAATAGIVSLFNGSNTGSNAFGSSSYNCTTTDTTTPCVFARTNGFGTTSGTGADTVYVEPNPSGVTIPNLDGATPNSLRVTITRPVNMTLTQLLGLSSFNVKAHAVAAIVDVMAPVPIIITHPWLSGSFNLSGTGSGPKIQICGGPARSIQVNSSDSGSMTWNGNPAVDLHLAGPNDPGNCTTGTGADFGDFGGPSNGGTVLSNQSTPIGSTEHFVQPADPILDPLSGVAAPSAPAAAHAPVPLANGTYGCPSSPAKACELYFPGLYTNTAPVSGGINVQNQTAVFAPGIYYMNGSNANFQTAANGYMQMATGLTDSSTTVSVTLTGGSVGSGGVTSCCGTNQGWDGTGPASGGGMLVYMTGSTVTSVGSGHSACSPTNPAAVTGQISIGANGSVSLAGSPSSGTYKGILFFVDRSAVSQSDTLDGGGGLTLVGTIYMPETVSQMGTTSSTTCSQYQSLTMQGNAGSSTHITGEIIVSALTLGGTPGIVMNLNPNATAPVRQIALVQ